MKRIIIIEPKTIDGNWALGNRKRKSAYLIFYAVKRRLQARTLNKRTAIRVKYADCTTNDSLTSNEPRYLLYTLGCFLEDYLSDATVLRIEKNYSKK